MFAIEQRLPSMPSLPSAGRLNPREPLPCGFRRLNELANLVFSIGLLRCFDRRRLAQRQPPHQGLPHFCSCWKTSKRERLNSNLNMQFTVFINIISTTTPSEHTKIRKGQLWPTLPAAEHKLSRLPSRLASCCCHSTVQVPRVVMA